MSDSTEDGILKSLDESQETTTDDTEQQQQQQDQSVEDNDTQEKATPTGDKSEESPLDAALRKASGEETVTTTATNKKVLDKDDKTKGPKQAKPQDLVDEKGNVIATGGRERRFYETAQREKVRADKLDTQLRDLQTKIGAYEKSNAIGTQLGLSPQELVTGANLMASLKADPVAAVKYMLTQVQAAGHNIEGIGGGVDMKALRSMLSEALQPITQEREGKLAEERARQEASEVYTDFITRYPDARVHEATLARLLEQDGKLSPEAAYYKLRSFYSERGLDFTKPLAAIQAELNKKGTATTQGVRRDSIPSGGASESNITSTNDVSLGANARTEDIVKAAMRDTGMNVNF